MRVEPIDRQARLFAELGAELRSAIDHGGLRIVLKKSSACWLRSVRPSLPELLRRRRHTVVRHLLRAGSTSTHIFSFKLDLHRASMDSIDRSHVTKPWTSFGFRFSVRAPHP
ncbi:hypothetical protein BQ8482_110206 [Mesorhizobium delmotii]|uniref:Uncharacterized protein n=1 Tax=Mesorhizobium delmotii TaxID=1631247 RepID=A0A2P9AAX9_9HYPH|nr:hypothetical protein BQ8482_110206 [Mesorhizobium delmotii]